MVFLTAEIMVSWTAMALIAGLALGAMICSAEKVRQEESLEAIFARLAGERFVR